MTKRKISKAARGLRPILKKIQDDTGTKTPANTLFNYSAEAFIQNILDTQLEVVAQRLYYYSFGKMTYEDALEYAREMKAAIDRAFEERLKKVMTPTEYPLSRAIIDGLTGTTKEGVRCIDENKLKTPAHFKLEHIFLTLLNDNSTDKNPKSRDYFTGNLGAEMIPASGGAELQSARVEVGIRDIFKRWAGGRKLGATDKKFILKKIEEYRHLVFTWEFQAETGDGKVLTVNTTAPRVRVDFLSISDRETTDKIHAGEIKSREAAQRVVLRFHPAFLSFTMSGHYAKTPADLGDIIEQAAGGGKKVTAAHWRLFHYLNSYRSTRPAKDGIVTHEEGRRELMEKIGLEGYLHGRNEARGEAALLGIMQDIKKTGLIKSFRERRGGGGAVVCIEIHKEPIWSKRGD